VTQLGLLRNRHQERGDDFLYRRIIAFVELSCFNSGSWGLSSSGTILVARTLPNSTPH
jgi:hypothetical protein